MCYYFNMLIKEWVNIKKNKNFAAEFFEGRYNEKASLSLVWSDVDHIKKTRRAKPAGLKWLVRINVSFTTYPVSLRSR